MVDSTVSICRLYSKLKCFFLGMCLYTKYCRFLWKRYHAKGYQESGLSVLSKTKSQSYLHWKTAFSESRWRYSSVLLVPKTMKENLCDYILLENFRICASTHESWSQTTLISPYSCSFQAVSITQSIWRALWLWCGWHLILLFLIYLFVSDQ